MLTVILYVLIPFGLILGFGFLAMLINMDWGGSPGNTFNFKLTQSQKARRHGQGPLNQEENE